MGVSNPASFIGVTPAELEAHAAKTDDVHGIVDTAALILEGDARLTDARPPVAHGPAVADVTGLQSALDGKQAAGSYAAASHGHAIADVTGLQTALDGKSAVGHTHAWGDITGKPSTFAPSAHKSAHVSGGGDAFASTDLLDAVVRRLRESGGQDLLLGAVADGEYLRRSGSSLVGGPGGGGSVETVVRQAADVTHASASFVDTDLVFTFGASEVWILDLYAFCTSAATSTGYRFAFDTSVAVTAVGLTFVHVLANTGTVSAGDSAADNAARGLSSGVAQTTANIPVLGRGLLVAGGSGGTCRLRFGPEVAASATFKANSVLVARRVA
jgi:hypothetical protein